MNKVIPYRLKFELFDCVEFCFKNSARFLQDCMKLPQDLKLHFHYTITAYEKEMSSLAFQQLKKVLRQLLLSKNYVKEDISWCEEILLCEFIPYFSLVLR
ncbi:MAG: hypothetical protein IJT36_02735 [Alphaproteobacteria bacterium]|nr:hypothetical protein [Alphaproteobacteria bacterium]